MWGGVFPTCGELSGTYVGIFGGGWQGEKSPARHAMKHRSVWQGQADARSGDALFARLHQPQLRGAPDGRPAIVDAELTVDALGVGADGAQGDHQPTGDLRAGELGPEQPEHFELAL